MRVSDDLTIRQRQKLKDLKQKGYTGYFYKGQIHTRTKSTKSGPNCAAYMINNDSSELGPKRRQLESNNAANPTDMTILNQPLIIQDAVANGINDHPKYVSIDSVRSHNSNL